MLNEAVCPPGNGAARGILATTRRAKPDGTHGTVSTARGTPRVSVSISALNGDPVTANDLTADLRVGATVRERSLAARGLRLLRSMKPHASTTLEASRLALVLAVAVFGLVVNTAQHQASKLTPLEAVGAVFALGFGAAR